MKEFFRKLFCAETYTTSTTKYLTHEEFKKLWNDNLDNMRM